LSFETESEAREYASQLAEDLQLQAPTLLDLDAIREWCDHSNADTLDATSVWRCWYFLRDAGVSTIPNAIPGEPGYDESEVFDNLLMWATAANSEWNAAHKRPWQPAELTILARIIREGLMKLETQLRRH
jgi:hypothetical protein